MSHSNGSAAGRKAASKKPSKPYEGYPLFPHATGRWAKKIRGKLHYFGPWSDPDAALQKYLDRRDDLHAGRTPRATGDGLTVRDLVNRFLTAKEQQRDTGEIRSRTFDDYHSTCERLISVFGRNRLVDDLASDDFEQLRAHISKSRGLVSLGNEVGRTRVVFKYGYDAGLIDKPIRFGPMFKRPSKRKLRELRASNGERMFEDYEILALLDAAPTQLKAMILLAINCGFGNSDCGALTNDAVDLKKGWVRFPRTKTGADRRCPLWPETVAALRAVSEKRPEPASEAEAQLVFLTRVGKSWRKETNDNPVSNEMGKLVRAVEVVRPGSKKKEPIYRKGVGFYALRHTFETIGGESRDQVSVDFIMGHARDDMASVYRERISDERLIAVTDHVRKWLWPKARKTRRKVTKD